MVEVGAGAGALTQALADSGAQVYAIEIDERLRPILEERFEDQAGVYLAFADILKTDIPTLVGDADYLVVANVPYYISSAILWHFLESRRPPLRMLLTMQYEVAERVISAPGAMNLLAIAVQFHGVPRIVSKLSPAVFWPRPHIYSAIVRIDTHADSPGRCALDAGLFSRGSRRLQPETQAAEKRAGGRPGRQGARRGRIAARRRYRAAAPRGDADA